MLVRGIKLVFNKCPNYPLSMSKKLYFRTLVKPGLQVYLRDWHVSKGLSFCFGGRAQNPPSCFFSLAFGFRLLALASLVFGFGLLAGVRTSPFLCLKSRISGHLLNEIYMSTA